MSNPAQPFDSRRSTIYSRQPEELHIPSGNSSSGAIPRQSMPHEYPTSPDTNLPSINIHPSGSQSNQYGSGNSGGTGGALPGALQPGNPSNRPPAVSVNTAPSVLPTLPQLSTQVQQQQSQPHPQSSTPRSNAANSHGHSRSSPAGYRPPGSSPNAGFQPPTPQGAKYSPLGLADIRSPGDLLSDHITNTGAAPLNSTENQVPTNSNYITPWPIYAVDWCKWPVSGNAGSFGGKIALGSYLEDHHNYVS